MRRHSSSDKCRLLCTPSKPKNTHFNRTHNNLRKNQYLDKNIVIKEFQFNQNQSSNQLILGKENFQPNRQYYNHKKVETDFVDKHPVHHKNFILKNIKNLRVNYANYGPKNQHFINQFRNDSQAEKSNYIQKYRSKKTVVQSPIQSRSPENGFMTLFQQEQLQNLDRNIIFYNKVELTANAQKVRSDFIEILPSFKKKNGLVRNRFRAIQYYDYLLMSQDSTFDQDIQYIGLGLACLWVSGKIEDVDPFTAEEILNITGRRISYHVLIEHEKQVQQKLKFNIYRTLELDLIQKQIEVYLDLQTDQNLRKQQRVIFEQCVQILGYIVHDYRVRLKCQSVLCQTIVAYILESQYGKQMQDIARTMDWNITDIEDFMDLFYSRIDEIELC